MTDKTAEAPAVRDSYSQIIHALAAIAAVRACHEAEAGGQACDVSARSAVESAARQQERDALFAALDRAGGAA